MMEELVVSILRSFSIAFIYGKMKLIQLTTVKVDCLGIETANRMIDDHAWVISGSVRWGGTFGRRRQGTIKCILFRVWVGTIFMDI